MKNKIQGDIFAWRIIGSRKESSMSLKMNISFYFKRWKGEENNREMWAKLKVVKKF